MSISLLTFFNQSLYLPLTFDLPFSIFDFLLSLALILTNTYPNFFFTSAP